MHAQMYIRMQMQCTFRCKMHSHMSMHYAYTGAKKHVQSDEYAHAQLHIYSSHPLHIMCWLWCPGLSHSNENMTSRWHVIELCASSKCEQVLNLSIFSQACDIKWEHDEIFTCEYAFAGSREHSSDAIMLLELQQSLSIPHAGELRQCFPQKGLSRYQMDPPGHF